MRNRKQPVAIIYSCESRTVIIVLMAVFDFIGRKTKGINLSHRHCEERSPEGASDEVPKASRTTGQSAKKELPQVSLIVSVSRMLRRDLVPTKSERTDCPASAGCKKRTSPDKTHRDRNDRKKAMCSSRIMPAGWITERKEYRL
ncbi:MAG: hypothetical protein ABSA44_07830 [Bacteroidota bacterium]